VILPDQHDGQPSLAAALHAADRSVAVLRGA